MGSLAPPLGTRNSGAYSEPEGALFMVLSEDRIA
jgi:hypothetical protein